MQKSIYGSVVLTKSYCEPCDGTYFVIDGKFKCCSRNYIGDGVIKDIKRETTTERFLNLSDSFKNRICEIQKWKCYLCGTDMSESWFYFKKNVIKELKINFDHFIPKTFLINNNIDNIYMMCNICNLIKSNKIFDNRDEAIQFVMDRRKELNQLNVYSLLEIEGLKDGKNGIYNY